MAGVRNHEELDTWRLFEELRARVARMTARPGFARFPKLKGQLVDAAESCGPNIAEGFSRYHPRDFARFVRTSKASATEILEHMKRVRRERLADENEIGELCSVARRARGAAKGLILYLENATAPHLPRTRPRRSNRA